MASADESLMISMYSIVGSDLRRLHEASWLLISYNLGYSIALPIVSYDRQGWMLQFDADPSDQVRQACPDLRSKESVTHLVCSFYHWQSMGVRVLVAFAFVYSG